MHFEPQPENDFQQFWKTYYGRCREAFSGIRAVAAKWTAEDLIPGLSDFDTRFILRDDMTTEEWCHLSLEVGRVHTQLAREFPSWARNLEHLPGINLTAAEITDPLLFYPEFQQWTYYDGDPDTVRQIEEYLASHAWSRRDELFQLKKISTFFGPYIRGIDPPINIGPWESKYPLHSRFMHYFAPPVQAGVSLAEHRNVAGKFEALRRARELFPQPETIDMILESVERHYEVPEYYEEPRVTEIERELEQYLVRMWAALADHIILLAPEASDDKQAVAKKVSAVPIDPVESFYASIKFGRLLRGRLLFYAGSIPWFDSEWLIHNELNRLVSGFFTTPLTVYGRIRFDESVEPEEVVRRIRGELLDDETCDDLLAFAKVASAEVFEGAEKDRSREVAGYFDAVLVTAEALAQDLLHRLDLG